MLQTLPTNIRNTDAVLLVQFRNHPMPNEMKTAEAGRPIFDDMEVCEIRGPGSRNTTVQPAFAPSHWEEDPSTGLQRRVTYAERFQRQYQQFKASQTQTMRGTPLDHVPFLTEARRAELRALNIYTAEQLAEVDGQELKNLGPGGRDMKNRAIEYIAEAKTHAPSAQLVVELDTLRAKLAVLEEDNAALKQRAVTTEGEFSNMNDEQLAGYITSKTGGKPIGNLSRRTLVKLAQDATPKQVT